MATGVEANTATPLPIVVRKRSRRSANSVAVSMRKVWGRPWASVNSLYALRLGTAARPLSASTDQLEHACDAGPGVGAELGTELRWCEGVSALCRTAQHLAEA